MISCHHTWVNHNFDISREDLHLFTSQIECHLWSLIYGYWYVCTSRLLFTGRKAKKTICFICVCACVSVYFLVYCNAYLFHIIFAGSKSSYELSRSCSQNIYDSSRLLCFKYMHELLRSLTIHVKTTFSFCVDTTVLYVIWIYGLKQIAQLANNAQSATHIAYIVFTFSLFMIPLHPTQ